MYANFARRHRRDIGYFIRELPAGPALQFRHLEFLEPASVSPTGLALAVAAGGSLTLFAANPGAWGNNLRISITPQAADPTRFGLLVQQVTSTGRLQTVETLNTQGRRNVMYAPCYAFRVGLGKAVPRISAGGSPRGFLSAGRVMFR
jgi:hypothetical protein